MFTTEGVWMFLNDEHNYSWMKGVNFLRNYGATLVGEYNKMILGY